MTYSFDLPAFFANEWETLKSSFDFIPNIIITHGSELFDRYPWLLYAALGFLAVILVYSFKIKPKCSINIALSSMVSIMLVTAFFIWLGMNNYDFNGFFGIIQTFLSCVAAVTTVLFICFSLGTIALWIRLLSPKRLVSIILFFPVCMATAILVARLAGIPAYQFFVTHVMGDPDAASFTSESIRAAIYAGFIAYVTGIKEAAYPKNWISIELAAAFFCFIACFYTLGLALFLLIVPVRRVVNTFYSNWCAMSPAEKVTLTGTSSSLNAVEQYELEHQLLMGDLTTREYQQMKDSVHRKGYSDPADRAIVSGKYDRFAKRPDL